MATLGMFGSAAPRIRRLQTPQFDPLAYAPRAVLPSAPESYDAMRDDTRASPGDWGILGGRAYGAPQADAPDGASGRQSPVASPSPSGRVPPTGAFGQYKLGQRDWLKEIGSDPLGFILTGSNGLDRKRSEAYSLYEAQQQAAENQRQMDAMNAQLDAAGITGPQRMVYMANPAKWGESMAKNYEPANVSGGDTRVFGNGQTFTAPKLNVADGFAYVQTPEGTQWQTQRPPSYAENTAAGIAAEQARHNRATEGIDRAKAAQGGVQSTPDFGSQNTFRNQYLGQAKPFVDVRDAYSRIRQTMAARSENPNATSPAADISLIFNFMKMNDPGSTVREGEYATAQNAAGVPDQIRNAYNRAMSGESLNPNQREDFLNAARSLYDAQEKSYSQTFDFYRNEAARNGLRPEIIPDLRLPKAAPSPITRAASAIMNRYPIGGAPAPAQPAAAMSAPGATGGLSPADQAELEALRKEFGITQ